MPGESGPLTLETWLAGRLDSAPPELAEAVWPLVRGRLADGEDGLVHAALDALAVAAEGEATRAEAVTLLAADAILTYALEAAADPALGGSAARASRLARRAGPGGLIGKRFNEGEMTE
ncbi:MAG: hypothetical protein OXI39_01270 [Gemmatimonadota bacterium]|uniref:hypothetical protein n=1 Tax=Candidatus Palauibacter scopulicola TaxID=3056741 RepID=UPI0023A2ABB0|nr:hypothetical protein [Candidatus Palauibacter scopulicola]MDE2661620.1 hypothetical protein [Candidatus Palauibacter scopulicola]